MQKQPTAAVVTSYVLHSSFCILPSACGKLDQSTERSLISFFRWVQLPLPLPPFARSAAESEGCRAEAKRRRAERQTNPASREVIQLPDCKSDVVKPAGSDDWSV